MLQATPRLTRNRKPATDLVIYTDAATATMIIAAIIVGTPVVLTSRALSSVLPLRVGKHWPRLFRDTALIYGLEMLAIFAVLIDPTVDLVVGNVTFYADSSNALQALASNAQGPPVIAAMTQLIWFRISELNMAAWFDRAPSKKNIADLPTNRIPAPFPSLTTKAFRCLPR